MPSINAQSTLFTLNFHFYFRGGLKTSCDDDCSIAYRLLPLQYFGYHLPPTALAVFWLSPTAYCLAVFWLSVADTGS